MPAHPGRQRHPQPRPARTRQHPLTADRRSNVILEFAICAPVFLALLLATFEVSYDYFLQGLLDAALQQTAREIQLGETQTATTEPLMVSSYLSPASFGLMAPGGLYMRIERIDTTSCPGVTADLYDATNGQLPETGRALALGLYGGPGGNGNAPFTCDQQGAADTGYCVAGPNGGSPEAIVASAIYVAPSFLGQLVPSNVETFNGNTVHAVYAAAAFLTEGFTQTYTGTNGC